MINLQQYADTQLINDLLGVEETLPMFLQRKDYGHLTPAKRRKAEALKEIIRRGAQVLDRQHQNRYRITNSDTCLTYVRLYLPHLAVSSYEMFYILTLNRNNVVTGHHQISSGGVSGTVVDPKLIFSTAIRNEASAIVLIHNHPSGNTRPSDNDEKLTRKIAEAGRMMDINVIEHLIVTEFDYYSFANEGFL